MRKSGIMLLLIILAGNTFADIYKWVDSQGDVHFSDTPRPGAQKLNIPDAQTFSPAQPAPQAPEEPSNGNTKQLSYRSITVVQPENEATIRNNDGSITVAVEIEPELFPGDRLQLIFDGSSLGEPQTGLQFQLSGIYRGSHTIAVQIVDPQNQVLETSDPITIYMFRPRVGMGATGK